MGRTLARAVIVPAAVRSLVEARREGRTVPAPALPDAAAAYAVQDGVAHALGWFAGAAPRAWKSGAPSHDAVQTHAPLPPAGVWASPAQARGWPFQRRGIEAEIALRLARDVDAGLAARLDAASAAALVDAMCVAIEIVDSRWTEGLAAPALARLADLQSHGALVLSAWTGFAPRDWTAQPCRVRIGARSALEFRGTHALGDPARVLPQWLRHAARAGGGIVAAGTVVTTGTWCGIVDAGAGDEVHAEFAGIGQASVAL